MRQVTGHVKKRQESLHLTANFAAFDAAGSRGRPHGENSTSNEVRLRFAVFDGCHKP